MDGVERSGGKAIVVAFHPGYLRLKIPGLYRSERERERIEATLSGRPQILAVYANVLTGKALILCDAAISLEDICSLLNVTLLLQDKAVLPAHAEALRPTGEMRDAAGRSRRTDDIYPPWHLHPPEDAIAAHGSDRRFGLSSEEAGRRLRQGRNALPRKPPQSAAAAFLNQFKGLPVALLGASAALSLLTGGLAEAVAIAAVLVMNGYIGFATERRAEKTIASLSELVDDTAPVVRDGRMQEIPTVDVVPGDILVLLPGVHIAADARIVDTRDLAIDESTLTGESHFVPKGIAPLSRSTPLAERDNMVYTGTAVALGTGMAVAVGTGANTEIGRIDALMASVEQPQTPIQKQLDDLGNRLVKVSIAICAAVFFIGLLRGQRMLQMLKASISLAIAAVPEGLPTVATTSLARGLVSMRRRQMLIRRLQAVETLGAIQTICFDKTGTLTFNRMSAVSLQTMNRVDETEDGSPLWEDHGPVELPSDLKRLLEICVLSNEHHVSGNGAGDSSPDSPFNGSSTENALVRLAVAAGIASAELRHAYPLLHAEMRGVARNYMTTVHAVAGSGMQLVAVKGNPVEVLELCDRVRCGNDIVALSAQAKRRIAAQNAGMAERQLRVLGFAYRDDRAGYDAGFERDVERSGSLIWLGLVGLADPVRPRVANVIEAFHRAGIRTAMITGDQRATASAIGSCVGLAGNRPPTVLEPGQLTGPGGEALARSVSDADIFARVTPAQKLQIMYALQQTGRVVAMTGDGINDGPALRAADVGIAMGKGGTNLARSAADVVLKDDRLETVLEAISQGRTITGNIEKSLHFLISSNLSEILFTFGAVTVTGASPLSPIQLLWINLLSDVLPAIALAFEPPDADVMKLPPRDPGKPLIDSSRLALFAREGTLLSAGALGVYAYEILRHGAPARASGVAFNSLMLGQLLHAFTCRSKEPILSLARRGVTNPKLGMAIGASIGLQALINVVPGVRRFFGLRPATLGDVAAMIAGAVIPMMANEAGKTGNASRTARKAGRVVRGHA